MTLDRVLELWGKLPTTQFNCVMSGLIILMTAIRYIVSHDTVLANGTVSPHWVPDTGWEWFLLAYAGVNTAHFLGKRLTDASYAAAKGANNRVSGAVPAP